MRKGDVKRPEREGTPVTAAMRRIIRRMGIMPNYCALGRKLGIHRKVVERIIREQRFTREVQEAVARWAGMTVHQLFGRNAWFRVQKRAGRNGQRGTRNGQRGAA